MDGASSLNPFTPQSDPNKHNAYENYVDNERLLLNTDPSHSRAKSAIDIKNNAVAHASETREDDECKTCGKRGSKDGWCGSPSC